MLLGLPQIEDASVRIRIPYFEAEPLSAAVAQQAPGVGYSSLTKSPRRTLPPCNTEA
jgi:hypothetical protein